MVHLKSKVVMGGWFPSLAGSLDCIYIHKVYGQKKVCGQGPVSSLGTRTGPAVGRMDGWMCGLSQVRALLSLTGCWLNLCALRWILTDWRENICSLYTIKTSTCVAKRSAVVHPLLTCTFYQRLQCLIEDLLRFKNASTLAFSWYRLFFCKWRLSTHISKFARKDIPRWVSLDSSLVPKCISKL